MSGRRRWRSGPWRCPTFARAKVTSRRRRRSSCVFDLVYVLAVTQLSHLLIDDLSLAGAGRAAVLLVVAWWAWIYTTWMVNWFDLQPATGRQLIDERSIET